MTSDPSLTTNHLRLCLAGAARLFVDGGRVLALERKDAALLALLVLDGPTRRARAAALLWPDTSERQARTNLRQRLFRLQRAARRELVQGGAVLQLADGLAVDLDELLAKQAADAASGDLLDGLDYGDNEALEQWVLAARQRWRRRRLDALAQRASELEAAGQIAAALPLAQRLVVEEPTQEHAHRRLMRLHHLRGDRAAALAAYGDCRRLLAAELGHAPGTETRELAAAIAEGGHGAPVPVTAPLPAALRRPPRMVGRDAAWAALARHLDEGRPVIVVAEAGLGKTRLLEEQAASDGALCLLSGRHGDEGAPYALLARLLQALHARHGRPPCGKGTLATLATLVPDLGVGAGRVPEPAALRLAVEQALHAWHAAGLRGIAVDDLHFADAVSVELLVPLACAPGVGLRWLLASRPQPVPAALAVAIDDPPAVGLVELRLAPLDEAGFGELLASLQLAGLDPAFWQARLYGHCGGNPMLALATLGELHRQGWALPPDELPLPRTATLTLVARLRQLSAPALLLAQVACMAVPDFGADLAASVLECSVPALIAAWRELEDADVLRGERFAHDLVRAAAAAAVPRPLARALHRRIAGWLAARGAPPARVAGHWWACEDWTQAAQALERAAEEAAALALRSEELELLRRAADAHARAGATASAFVCSWRAVHTMLVADRIDGALAAAEALAADAVDPAQRQFALEARAAVRNERTESELALADVQAARACAPAPLGAEMEVRLAQREAMALMRLNCGAQALQVLDAAREAALALPDAALRLAWRCDRASALDYNDRLEEAAATFAEVAADAEAAGRWIEVVAALGNLAVTLVYLGRQQECRRHAERAVAIGRRYGSAEGNVLIDEMTLAGTLRDLGRYDEAIALGERVVDDLRRVGHLAWAANAEGDVAGTWLWLGRPDLALKALRPLPADAPAWVQGSRLIFEARIEAARERPVGDRIERAAALLAQFGRSYVRLKVALERARQAPPAEAAVRAAHIVEQALASQQRALAGQALQLHVDALRRAGQTAAAGEAALRLVAHLRGHDPCSTYVPEPWWVACRALHAAGDYTQARAALDHALEWVETQALPHVPALYCDNFLSRNPTNAALRRARAGVMPVD